MFNGRPLGGLALLLVPGGPSAAGEADAILTPLE